MKLKINNKEELDAKFPFFNEIDDISLQNSGDQLIIWSFKMGVLMVLKKYSITFHMNDDQTEIEINGFIFIKEIDAFRAIRIWAS